MQKEDFDKFNASASKSGKTVQPVLHERLDTKALEAVSKLPSVIEPNKPFISEKLLSFNSQKDYIDSLNLREVCYSTFSNLQESISKIQKHFDPHHEPKGTNDLESYQLLLDVTQQRNFLNVFNQNFKRVINHILEISGHLSSQESIYTDQIESLSRQNQVLFDENIALQDKLLQKHSALQSHASSQSQNLDNKN